MLFISSVCLRARVLQTLKNCLRNLNYAIHDLVAHIRAITYVAYVIRRMHG